MIKQDCSESEESESQGSGSDSEEVKEVLELPPLEKTNKCINSEDNSRNLSRLQEKTVKRKLILNEKFAKRLQQIREKRKKAKRAEATPNFPSIISSVSTNRRFKSSGEKEAN